jgi:hypothetical protein
LQSKNNMFSRLIRGKSWSARVPGGEEACDGHWRAPWGHRPRPLFLRPQKGDQWKQWDVHPVNWTEVSNISGETRTEKICLLGLVECGHLAHSQGHSAIKWYMTDWAHVSSGWKIYGAPHDS